MRIRQENTVDVITGELGRRLRDYRLDHKITQAELATKAGLDRRSVAKIEKGGDITLTSLILILQAIQRVYSLNELLPESSERIKPFEVLERQAKKPQRVKHPKSGKETI